MHWNSRCELHLVDIIHCCTIKVSFLPGSLFHLHLSCIQSWRPKAEGWTQSPCWGPPQHSSEGQRTHLSQTCFSESYPFPSVTSSRISELSYTQIEVRICCNIGELTLFLVVVMAQAALVSHLKLAVQFWYIRNCGCSDCTECNTNSLRHMKSIQC